MDSQDILVTSSFLASSGMILSQEERSALQTSLALLKSESKFYTLWYVGKVLGIARDYYIAQGFEQKNLQRKSFSSNDALNWSQLPEATDADKIHAKQLQQRFTGSLSTEFKIFVPGADSSAEPPTITEEKRLAGLIALLDEQVSVVPRGAYVKTPTGDIVKNRNFTGIPKDQSLLKSSYFHFSARKSANKPSEKDGLDRSIDFLEPISNDQPKCGWTFQNEGGRVLLKSIAWPGSAFFHVPETRKFGYLYYGLGNYNTNVAFMI